MDESDEFQMIETEENGLVRMGRAVSSTDMKAAAPDSEDDGIVVGRAPAPATTAATSRRRPHTKDTGTQREAAALRRELEDLAAQGRAEVARLKTLRCEAEADRARWRKAADEAQASAAAVAALEKDANAQASVARKRVDDVQARCESVAGRFETEYRKMKLLHEKYFEFDEAENKEFFFRNGKTEQYYKLSDFVARNRALNDKLRKYFQQTRQLEEELKNLSELKARQLQTLEDSKAQLDELAQAHRRDALVTLAAPDYAGADVFACSSCGADVGRQADVESQSYQVGQGAFTEKKRGYLFRYACNLKLGMSKPENFTTGTYHISWCSCLRCDAEIGWKYVGADTPTNSEKVGKYCLARAKLATRAELKQRRL